MIDWQAREKLVKLILEQQNIYAQGIDKSEFSIASDFSDELSKTARKSEDTTVKAAVKMISHEGDLSSLDVEPLEEDWDLSNRLMVLLLSGATLHATRQAYWDGRRVYHGLAASVAGYILSLGELWTALIICACAMAISFALEFKDQSKQSKNKFYPFKDEQAYQEARQRISDFELMTYPDEPLDTAHPWYAYLIAIPSWATFIPWFCFWYCFVSPIFLVARVFFPRDDIYSVELT